MKKFVMSFVIGIGVIIMGFFCIGCEKKAELEQAVIQAKKNSQDVEYQKTKNSEIIIQKLNNKYGKDFTLLAIEKVQGVTALDDGFYLAEFYEDGDQDEFRVYWYNEKELLQDTYAKILYKNEFSQIIDSILEKSDNFQKFNYKIYYQESEKTWKENEFEEYLSESGSYIDIECEAGDMESKEVSKYLYQIVEILRNRGAKYFIRCNWEGRKVYLNDDIEIHNEEELLKKMKE